MYAGALLALTTLSVFVQGFQLWSLTMIVVGLLALNALGLIRAFDRSDPIAPGAVGLTIALFTVWLFISAQLSELDSIAQVGLYEQLTLPLAFLAYLLAPDKERLWGWITQFSGLACALLALAALAEPVYRAVPTLSALFVQRNSLSGFLLLLTFILLPALGQALGAVVNRRRALVMWTVPIFLSLFVVSFSASRAAIGAFVIAFGGFYLSGSRAERDPLGKYVLALALWSFLLADVALQGELRQSMQSLQVVSAHLIDPYRVYSDDEFSVTADRDDRDTLSPLMRSKVSSANERFLIWRATLEMVENLPWSGFGPGTFRSVYPSFGVAADRSSRNYAHNDYLQIYAELGAIGLACCIGLGGAVAWRWSRHLKRRKACEGTRAINALFWGMLAVGAHSVFTYNFYVPATLVMFGLVLARFVSITAPEPGSSAVVPFRGFRRSTVVFILLVCASIPTITLTSATAMIDYLTMLRDLRKETGDAAGARAADRELERIRELVGAAS